MPAVQSAREAAQSVVWTRRSFTLPNIPLNQQVVSCRGYTTVRPPRAGAGTILILDFLDRFADVIDPVNGGSRIDNGVPALALGNGGLINITAALASVFNTGDTVNWISYYIPLTTE